MVSLYYRSVSQEDPVQQLRVVIREEYERLDGEIAALENRKAQLAEILSEHRNQDSRKSLGH